MAKELEEITPLNNEESYDILYSEVEDAINTLKRNKSPGSDGITAELLQAGGKQQARQIHKLCNNAWEEGTGRSMYFETIRVDCSTFVHWFEARDCKVSLSHRLRSYRDHTSFLYQRIPRSKIADNIGGVVNYLLTKRY